MFFTERHMEGQIYGIIELSSASNSYTHVSYTYTQLILSRIREKFYRFFHVRNTRDPRDRIRIIKFFLGVSRGLLVLSKRGYL